MIKKISVLLVMVMVLSLLSANVFAQEDDKNMITGTVEEVAEDGSYIILDGQKMMVDSELLEYMNMEAGDEVELVVDETDQGLVVVDFDYL
jgi:hypothetical protein